jgi:hypothetical protein
MNSSKTVLELKESLKKLGVSGYSGKNKKELVSMYNKAKRSKDGFAPSTRSRSKPKNITSVAKPVTKKPTHTPSKKRLNPKLKFNTLFDDATVSAFMKLCKIDKSELRTKADNMNMSQSEWDKFFRSDLDNLCDDTCMGDDDGWRDNLNGGKGGYTGGLGCYLRDSLYQIDDDAEMADTRDMTDPDSDIAMDYIYSVNGGKVCAILIAHKGECAKGSGSDKSRQADVARDWWTVRLICGRPNEPVCVKKAITLLGAYCYALKSKKSQRYGLLEVMDGHRNPRAYCLYSKFGFVESDFKCPSFVWLQMATDLNQLTPRQIAETVMSKGKQQIPDTQSTRYCAEMGLTRTTGLLPGPPPGALYPRKIPRKIKVKTPSQPIGKPIKTPTKSMPTDTDDSVGGGCTIM